jgi:methionyl-tRNA formyltransferase
MDRVSIYINGARGVAVAKAIAAAGHEIRWIIVPCNRTADFEAIAREVRGEILAPANINDNEFVLHYRGLKPRVGVVGGFSAILRKPTFEAPELGTINLHAGALPRYRGGSPLNWQIINGEREAGISVLRVDEGIDTGAILAEARLPIGPSETIAELHERAIKLFCKLVPDVLTDMENGAIDARQQDETKACYWHQRNEADGLIRWSEMGAQQVHDLVRGLTRPYPGAIARYRGSELRIFRAALEGIPLIRGVSGRVVWLQGRGPFVVCNDRALLLTEYEVSAGPRIQVTHGIHLDNG